MLKIFPYLDFSKVFDFMSLRIKLEIYSDDNIKAYADFAAKTCLKSNKGTSQY